MSERLKLKLLGRSVLKGKVGVHFPASVNADPPILITQVNGGYTISLDPSASGVSDGDKGDITVSDDGDTWSIDTNAVTYAKMQDISAGSLLLGRGDSGAGDPQEITLGSNLTMSGTTLNASAGVGTPGGANTNVQFNDGGVFGGDSALIWDKTNDILSIGSASMPIGGFAGRLQTHGNDTQWSLELGTWANNFGVGPTVTTGFSRNPAIGSHTIVNDGDTLFVLNCYGSNGAAFKLAGSMGLAVQGSPQAAGDNIPSAWTWSTSPDIDGATPVNRMQVQDNGALCLSGDGVFDLQALGTGLWPRLQLLCDAGVDRGISVLGFNNGDHGPDINLGLSRSGTHGAHVTVQDNDQCGSINIWGSDGDEWRRIVHIVGEADGAVANNLVPGRLVFAVCPAGLGDAFPNGKYVALYNEGTWGPYVDDGAPLGKTSKQWSDLFLASGAVIGFGGDLTVTHSTGALSVTDDLRPQRLTDTVVTLADGSPVPLDASLGGSFKLVATADRTISAPTNAPTTGRSHRLVIIHEASGANRTLTLTTGSAGAFRFGTDITGLTATLSGSVDYIGCLWNQADDRWDVVSYVKGF